MPDGKPAARPTKATGREKTGPLPTAGTGPDSGRPSDRCSAARCLCRLTGIPIAKAAGRRRSSADVEAAGLAAEDRTLEGDLRELERFRSFASVWSGPARGGFDRMAVIVRPTPKKSLAASASLLSAVGRDLTGSRGQRLSIRLRSLPKAEFTHSAVPSQRPPTITTIVSNVLKERTHDR